MNAWNFEVRPSLPQRPHRRLGARGDRLVLGRVSRRQHEDVEAAEDDATLPAGPAEEDGLRARRLERRAHADGVPAGGRGERRELEPAGCDGVTFLPYLAGERTPNWPHASGVLAGLRMGHLSRWGERAGPLHCCGPQCARPLTVWPSCQTICLDCQGGSDSSSVRECMPTLVCLPNKLSYFFPV